MPGKKGKVYIVGAGPGDPELITVKAMKILKKADHVIYDFLVSPKLPAMAKRSSGKICVGKADGLHLFEQGRINRLLYEKAKEGGLVVRLKGGDPLIFSRGIEEALYLAKRGIDFEIIPGITSAFAAPQSFGIPLTRRGKYSSVAVLTGRKSNGENIDAPDCDTLIYLMGVSNISNIIKAILASGRKPAMPCAFIERGTTGSERIVTGTLGTIVEKSRKYSIRAPAVFIVGEVVTYGKRVYGNKFKTR
jgi:uroporphyrin-III C-methyltransferase